MAITADFVSPPHDAVFCFVNTNAVSRSEATVFVFKVKDLNWHPSARMSELGILRRFRYTETTH